MRLSDYNPNQINKGGRRSAIEDVPDEVLAQLLEARRAGTHSVQGMLDWLHDESVHGDRFQHITSNMVAAFLRRNR